MSGPQMVAQAGLPCEVSLTDMAFVRSLSSVCADVNVQMRTMIEDLVAIITFERVISYKKVFYKVRLYTTIKKDTT